MLLQVFKCNTALLALKALTSRCTKQNKQKNSLYSGCLPECYYAQIKLTKPCIYHYHPFFVLEGGRFFLHFATSHCWEKPPAIPGIKYFCTGTVGLLHRYLILQGARNFPRIWNNLLLASEITRYSCFCFLVWLDNVHPQKAFETFFLKSSKLLPHTQ